MRQRRIRSSRVRAIGAGVVGGALVATLLGAPASASAAVGATPPRPAPPWSGARTGHVAVLPSHFVTPVEHASAYRPSATAWPAAASATLSLAAPVGLAREGATAHGA